MKLFSLFRGRSPRAKAPQIKAGDRVLVPDVSASASALKRFENCWSGSRPQIHHESHTWTLTFRDGDYLTIETSWRVRGSARIELTSGDYEQQFGLPKPIDAETHLISLIGRSEVTRIDLDQVTCDLTLFFSNGLALEILTDSSGYESWQAKVGNELFGRRLAAPSLAINAQEISAHQFFQPRGPPQATRLGRCFLPQA